MMRGFSILEVIIALAIITTTLIAVLLLTTGLQDVSANTRARHEGLLLASSGFLREIARGVGGFTLTRTLKENERDGLLSSVVATELGEGSAKMIESLVSWETRWGISQNTRVFGFVTDYENASDYACSPFLPGDWTKPKSDAYTGTLPPLAALSATRTFIVAAASSTVGLLDPSLFIFKNSKEDSGIDLIASFDSATSTKTGYVAVTTSSNYIYALSAHTCAQGSACASLDTFSLVDDALSRTHTLSLPPGRSILYKNGRLYVGLRTASLDAEFLVFNIGTSGQPLRIGSSEIGDSVNDMLLIGTTAYVATADNSSSGNKALMVFDTDKPHEGMEPVSRSHRSGAGISQRLIKLGSVLLLGRSSLLNSKELYVFGLPDIEHALSARDTDSSIVGLATSGFNAFVLTRTKLDRLYIEHPREPVLLNSFPLVNGMSGIALACSGRRLVVAENGSLSGHLIILYGL